MLLQAYLAKTSGTGTWRGAKALLFSGAVLWAVAATLAQSTEDVGPVPMYAYSPDGWTIGLCFDQAVNEASATNIAHFTLSDPRYAVASAALRPDGQSVSVRLARQYPLRTAKLSLTNITGLDGQSTPSTSVIQFGDFVATDIGDPGTDPREPGSYFTCRFPEFQVASSGSGWEGTNDGFLFVHIALGLETVGLYNWTIASLEAANKDSTIGVMLREDLSAVGRFVCVSVTPTDEAARDGSGSGSALVKVLWRDQPGTLPAEQSGTRSLVGLALTNLWFSILHSDRTVAVAWASRPGGNAERLAAVTFSSPVTGQWRIGLAAASHNNTPGFSSRSVACFNRVHGDTFTYPRLTTERTVTGVVLSWSSPSLELPYQLVSKRTLGSDTYWDVVTNSVEKAIGPSGVTNWVQAPFEAAAEFFGLGVGRGF